MHTTAAGGFLDGALYERGRPDYPPAVLEALAITRETTVADLGCGTGKLTRLLESTGASVIGIEPLPAMLKTFRSECPRVAVAAGLAEAIPFADVSFDVVACASAFHWFRHEHALPEIHRVLRPNGRLGIVWNRRDEITGWAAEFWQITEAHRRGTPSYRTNAWRDALERSTLFGEIEEFRFDNVQQTDAEGLIARVASISFVETLPPHEKDAVLAEARDFIATHPATRGRTILELPYHTAVYVIPRGD